ncbi:gephyrin-like molybdotransferase Glp [Cohaesibacter haloalkalitolerans]|uniref:molybdopterin molybdotransferase MoeA n=1 Tax=Cohaesibacter haloalkalitolerans TaxID=1162980 RepID=UPI000E65E656|nr:gephyrin-like molybdotransferase Glp [Cohaesibacter haloalkalitolerans]
MSLLKVEDALAQLLADVSPTETENVSLHNATGRVLAVDLKAQRTQPPFNASAMDGYAIRADNIRELPTKLQIVGEVPAGYVFPDIVHNWEAVRIFTGAPVPEGADAVVMQEKTERDGAFVSILQQVPKGNNIRPAGQDFKEGEVLLKRGTELTYRHLALAASMNHAVVPVYRRPVIAILSTGDELVLPGDKPSDGQIIASNNFAIASFAQTIGADVLDLGIARDDMTEISTTIEKAVAARVDCLVTIGGVSVGDHDLVQDALKTAGMDLTFWRIAMRPGKPLLAGNLGATRVLGLPGNPVSSMSCAILFLQPMIRKMLGKEGPYRIDPAICASPLPANDYRQSYMRARLGKDAEGRAVASLFSDQDSSKLASFAEADCLIVRPPDAPASKAGAPCQILIL